MHRSSKLYQDFFQLFRKAHPEVNGSKCQAAVNETWKGLKEGKGVDEVRYKEEMLKLKKKIEKKSIQTMFNAKTKPPTVLVEDEVTVPIEDVATESIDELGDDNQENHTGVNEAAELADEDVKRYETPAQTKVKEELTAAEIDLARLIDARNIGGHETVVALTRRITEVTKVRDNLKSKLKILGQNMKSQMRAREKKKSAIDKATRDFPQIASTLKSREQVGRPRLEEDQPNIDKDILEIATIGAACSDRRREDLFRTVKTLDDLHAAIKGLGYQISRSGLYLRLLPRDATTIHGKKHVKTVPVRLVRPENNLRKSHPDRMFAAETFKTGQDIVEFLGSEAAIYLSQDDKSAVHIGVTPSNSC